MPKNAEECRRAPKKHPRKGDVFKTIIPLALAAGGQATTQATTQATEAIESLLKYCEIPKSRSEMQESDPLILRRVSMPGASGLQEKQENV